MQLISSLVGLSLYRGEGKNLFLGVRKSGWWAFILEVLGIRSMELFFAPSMPCGVLLPKFFMSFAIRDIIYLASWGISKVSLALWCLQSCIKLETGSMHDINNT